MLVDKISFDKITRQLMKKDIIQDFEMNNGKITGHMMITEGKIPDELNLKLDNSRPYFIFEGSFDFYDSKISMGLYLDKFEPIGKLWQTPQNLNAKPIDKIWIEFFVQNILDNISDKGDFGIPMYFYMNDSSDFSVVPAMNDE